MSTTFAPVVDTISILAAIDTIDSNGANSSSAIPQPKPSIFLKPAITSWINAPFYDVPSRPSLSNPVPVRPAEFAPEADGNRIAEAAAEETTTVLAPAAPVMVAEFAAEETAVVHGSDSLTPTALEGFDLGKLSPPMLSVACESHISHVQKVLSFFQRGGESAKTFGKIFLNDLALQRTVLSALMNEPGNPMAQMESLHQELAVRLAACGQARQVAQLILADV